MGAVRRFLRYGVGIRPTLMAVCVVPVVVAMTSLGYFAGEVRSMRIDNELSRSRTTAELVATQTRYVIDGVAGQLYGLAALTEIQQADAKTCDHYLRSVVDSTNQDPTVGLPFERMGRVRPDGLMDCSTLPGSPDISVADRAYFLEARSTGHYYVSELISGRITKQHAVVIAVPIQTRDGLGVMGTGVLTAGITTGWLNDVLSKLQGENENWMIDAGGLVVAANPNTDLSGKPLPHYNELRSLIGDDQSGNRRVVLGGIDYTLSFARVPNTPFTVIVMTKVDVIVAPISNLMWGMAAVILGMTLLAVATTWSLCRQYLMEPINKLIEVTQGVRAGDFRVSVGIERSIQELYLLGNAVEEMVQVLLLKEGIIEAQIKNLEELAFYDRLTGLANMRLFRRDLDVARRKVERSGEYLVIVNIDLNGLKTVNDTMGHAAGDRLLEAAGKRISDSIRPTDTAARNGGDEFLVLMMTPSLDAAIDTGKRITRNLHQSLDIDGVRVDGRAAVGMAWVCGHQTVDLDGLMRVADAAMYDAKAASKVQNCSALRVADGDLWFVAGVDDCDTEWRSIEDQFAS